jgi:hypothetical protein
MKTKALGLVAAFTLIFVLAFSAAAPAAPNKNNRPVLAAAAQPSPSSATIPAERHPEIREAIAALRRAKQHMEHAAHDFGGHRVEAIRATDEAIHQLEEALKYDKD